MRILIASLLTLFLHQPALSHPADEGGLIVAFAGAERDAESGDVSVAVGLVNATGERATLRGARAIAGNRAKVLTSVGFLGYSYEREVRFFALDPGEARLLAPPEGRILVQSVQDTEMDNGTFLLTLYFGPLGSAEILVTLGKLPDLTFPEDGADQDEVVPFGPPPETTF